MTNTKIGIHTLCAYPPANLNRDEDGRPKTAIVGGTERLRVSSQARKRPWRLSESMASIDAGISTRTRELGLVVKEEMAKRGASDKLAKACAESIATCFGSVKKGTLTHNENVVYGTEEWDATMSLVELLASENREPTDGELKSLPRRTVSLDVAMFGRMRAGDQALNVDSAIAVSPLLSSHSVSIEADNWTALDDLNPIGSAGMGEVEFASAIMYGYVCIDVASLVENLSENTEVARASIRALMRLVALVGPQAMRSRFAQDVLPDLYRVEIGPAVYSHQSAFTQAINGESLMEDSIERLRSHAIESEIAYQLGLESWEVSKESPLEAVIDQVLSQVFAD